LILRPSDKNLHILNKNVVNEVKKVAEWLSNNKLTFNYTKTTYMLVSPQKCQEYNFKIKINEIL